MKIAIIYIVLNLVSCSLIAQEIKQTVKGKITDKTSGSPLSGASVHLGKEADIQITQANEEGQFSFTLPVGRYKISVSYTGYQLAEQELVVISGRESVVNIELTAVTQQLQEVEIKSSSLPALPGLRSLSIEKTLRVPANFFDPVRVVTAYPGVVTANDQNNAIIIRGNSPNGLLWRLNGLDIVNPNHLTNAGTLSDIPASNGGGVNILSAQMLDRTDFYTGAIPSNYGNALSGIVDMKLRDGNRNQFEYTAQASLIGLDVAAEGPVGKKKNTSFLANYRYSTIGLLSLMGVNFGDETISFQDLSFNLSSDLKSKGTFEFFGFWGGSTNEFNAKKPEEQEEDKDRYTIEYGADTYGAGINYSIPKGPGKFSAGVAFSGGRQERAAILSTNLANHFLTILEDQYQLNNALTSSGIRYETFNGKNVNWEIGVMINYLFNDLKSARTLGCSGCAFETTSPLHHIDNGFLLQPYANMKALLSKSLTLNAGFRYVYYEFNNATSPEPRATLSFKPAARSKIDLSYGLISRVQQPIVYAISRNQELKLTRSHHLDLSYSQSFTGDLQLRSGIFYQQLFNVPIEDNDASTFSALNLMEEKVPTDLVNKGTGKNYGFDMTLEKMFYNKNYFLFGGSYYDSKYTGGDGVERDTRFNGNFTFSGVYGKEWIKASRNRTIGLNTRVLYLGGLRAEPVNTNLSSSNGYTIFDRSGGFTEKLPDYFRLDLRLSFRKNKPRYTRTFAIDIQNLTAQENEAYQYYDRTQNKIVTKFQLSIIPILVYRIDF